MKNIIIALMFVMLSGCAVIQPVVDRFTIAPFDSNEYALVNKIRTQSQLAKQNCSVSLLVRADVDALFVTTTELKNYSQYIPKNKQTISPVDLLDKMVTEIHTRYNSGSTVSKTYCELKLTSINQSAESIQKAIAKRPRP